MKACPNCQTVLNSNAKFCHACGAKLPPPAIPCPRCRYSNPKAALFCASCGFNFEEDILLQEHYEKKYALDFSNTAGLAKEIQGHFIKALKKRVDEEHRSDQFGDYLNAFYETSYDKKFLIRAEQLAEESYTIHCRQDDRVYKEIDVLLDNSFNSLLDDFIIRYCKHLNEYPIPEAILKYDNVRQGEFDLPKLIWDFLDLEKEEERYYTNFLSMPMSKLKNASSSFLFPKSKEKILVIFDQTVFGSCKEGFALTESALYWKAHFEKARQVNFRDLKEIKKEKDWITINGNFFNVNPSLNLKMFKLLKKLKQIY